MVIDILKALFGGNANVVRETAEVFRVNAEAADKRAAEMQDAALEQMAAEFKIENRGSFDRFMDGVNRIPRPAMALGTLGLFIAAMIDPLWFGARMAGLALVPEPLWWLLGAIVSFYFGARYQAKGQSFQRSITTTLARAPQVAQTLRTLDTIRPTTPGTADTGHDADLVRNAIVPSGNRALDEWRGRAGRTPEAM